MDFLLQLDWLAVGQIILIDILLGGDNAIVIALACRNLPPGLRFRGILWGTLGAIVLRITLIASAVTLLEAPYLKLAGSLLLFWIGVKLLAEGESNHDGIHASERLLAAVKTIVLADLVMSIDNVIAVASAAENAGGEYRLALVVFGIVVSIPIIVWGSTLVLRLMSSFPAIVSLGAGMLGYLAGTMLVTDAALAPWIASFLPYHQFSVPGMGATLSLPGLLGAAGVMALGHWLARRGDDDGV